MTFQSTGLLAEFRGRECNNSYQAPSDIEDKPDNVLQQQVSHINAVMVHSGLQCKVGAECRQMSARLVVWHWQPGSMPLIHTNTAEIVRCLCMSQVMVIAAPAGLADVGPCLRPCVQQQDQEKQRSGHTGVTVQVTAEIGCKLWTCGRVKTDACSFLLTSVYRADAMVASGVLPWQLMSSISRANLHLSCSLLPKLNEAHSDTTLSDKSKKTLQNVWVNCLIWTG